MKALGRVADLRRFNTNLDPACHFNAYPDPHLNYANLQPVVCRTSRILFWASSMSVDGPPLHGSILSI